MLRFFSNLQYTINDLLNSCVGLEQIVVTVDPRILLSAMAR